MGTVYVLRGLPGSGKSTYTKVLGATRKFSADDFFLKDGVYQFDPNYLPQAHAYCLRSYTNWVRDPEVRDFGEVIAIDNTNISVAEVAPYAALALAYGWELKIINFSCPLEQAHARNTHGVPLSVMEQMAKKLEEETARFPPWWKQETVDTRA